MPTAPPATPTYDGTTFVPDVLADLLQDHFLTADNESIVRRTAAVLAGERESLVRQGPIAVLKALLGDGLTDALNRYMESGLESLDDTTRRILANYTGTLVQMAKDLGYREQVRCQGCGDRINVSHLCGYCTTEYRNRREADGYRVY